MVDNQLIKRKMVMMKMIWEMKTTKVVIMSAAPGRVKGVLSLGIGSMWMRRLGAHKAPNSPSAWGPYLGQISLYHPRWARRFGVARTSTPRRDGSKESKTGETSGN
jgi:hypothetical protein